MKRFLLILGPGLLVFIAASMVQEWEVFAPWLGLTAPTPPPVVDSAARQQAEVTLRQYLTLVSHLYQSDGDPRFAERLPAADPVGQQILDDIAYLKRNHRQQRLSLLKLQILDASELAPGRIELSTEEIWDVQVHLTLPESQLESSQRKAQWARYLLVRRGQSWQVQGVKDAEAPPAPAPVSGPGAAPTSAPAPAE